MFEVIMPKLGLTMETGIIEKWHKGEGDIVETGDILFEVMTDKVSLEVESYNSGVLKKIVYPEGSDVPVTEVVAYIGLEDEKFDESSIKKVLKHIDSSEIATIEKKPVSFQKTDKNLALANQKDSKKEDLNKKIFITPLARKKAKEMGLDYSAIDINGSGPGGRITKDDIIKHASLKKTEMNGSIMDNSYNMPDIRINSVIEITGVRKIIAEKMTISKQTIPHIIIEGKADVTDLRILKEKIQEKAENIFNVKITYTDFIIKAAAMALRNNLKLNSSFSGNKAFIFEDINLGLAISSEKGLVAPVIFNTDKLSINQIALKRNELIEKARSNKLGIQDVKGSTFTISNLGMYGARSFTAIINPPQSSILTVGEIYKDTYVDETDNIKIGSFINLSVAVDHRIIDGSDAALFMQSILSYLKNPLFII